MGLRLLDCPVLVSNGKAWVSLPSKSAFDQDGQQKRDINGKLAYVPVVQWRDRGLSDRFSTAAIALIREANPEALAAEPAKIGCRPSSARTIPCIYATSTVAVRLTFSSFAVNRSAAASRRRKRAAHEPNSKGATRVRPSQDNFGDEIGSMLRSQLPSKTDDHARSQLGHRYMANAI